MTQTIRITQNVKDDLRRQVDEKRISLQTQRKTKAAALAENKAQVAALEADIRFIDQQLADNLTESLAISSLRAGEYEIITRFGDQKPVFTSLFSTPQDFVYIVGSRSGGKSHTARWDEQDNDWRCDCESGHNRGWCWVTSGIKHGVRLDAKSNPFITDEKGTRHPVARFKRQV